MEQGTERVDRFAPVGASEVRVARALLSVSDKTGLIEFARGLAELGVEIVAPVVSPESYDAVLAELREFDRRLSPTTRESLAAEAFAYTARYDTAIARWFQEKGADFPALMVRAFEKVLELPYGENPHQRAAYYSQVGTRTHVLSMISQLGGKELSFNNLLDLAAGRLTVSEFQIPACAIIKHNNPCGVAVGTTGMEAYRK